MGFLSFFKRKKPNIIPPECPEDFLFFELFDRSFKSLQARRRKTLLYVGTANDVVEKLMGSFYYLIIRELHSFSVDFLFYPEIVSNKNAFANDMAIKCLYNFPTLRRKEHKVLDRIASLEPFQFYDMVRATYNLKGSSQPLILFIDDDKSSKNHLRTFPLSFDRLPADQFKIIIDQLDLRREVESDIISLFGDSSNYTGFSNYENRPRDEEPYNADIEFEKDTSIISTEVAKQLWYLLNAGNKKVLMDIFATFLTQARLLQPDLVVQFQKLDLIQSSDVEISRLVIDKHYRIWLPDYNRMEIEMTPLPKSLFLLFLRHPEGIKFPDLVNYKSELLSIYNQITNSSSKEDIRKRIDEMTDMRKNSINEKCSRIKEAFISKIEQRLANHYIISGGRGEAKRIVLDRSYVIYK